QRMTLKPWVVAGLALALAVITAGFLLWRGLAPTRVKTEEGSPPQVWQAGRTTTDPSSLVVRLLFSPDNKTLAWHSGDGSVRLLDVVTGQETTLPKADAAFRMPIGFTPDSRRLVTFAVEAPIAVFDVATAKEIARYPGSWTTALAPDCKSVATLR